MDADNQRRTQQRVPFPGFPGFAFFRALIVARAQSSPGQNMPICWKTRHVCAYHGYDRFLTCVADSGNLLDGRGGNFSSSFIFRSISSKVSDMFDQLADMCQHGSHHLLLQLTQNTIQIIDQLFICCFQIGSYPFVPAHFCDFRRSKVFPENCARFFVDLPYRA